MECFSALGLVRDLGEKRLVVGILAEEPEAADDGVGKIDFDAGKAVGPRRCNREAVPEESNVAGVIAAAHINNGARSELAQIEAAGRSQGRAGGSRFGGAGPTCTPSGGEAIARHLDRAQVWMKKPLPDLLLPQAVKVLDEVLKAGLGRRGEHWRYAKSQAETGDLAKGVRPNMPAFEDRAIIELGVRRGAVFAPVSEEELASLGGRNPRGGPSGGERMPLGTRGQHVKERATFQA